MNGKKRISSGVIAMLLSIMMVFQNSPATAYSADVYNAPEGFSTDVSNPIYGRDLIQLENEDEQGAAEMTVRISSSARDEMTEGETVVLTSEISGFDGYEIMYQWSCDKGSGFQNVEGANSSTYSFSATKESLSWDWKLDVYYR